MTLLTEVMTHPLDGGYAAMARRQGGARPGPASWVAVLVIALVLGVAVTWGVKLLRTPAESDLQARVGLERRAEQARVRLASLGVQAGELSSEIRSLDARLLASRDPAAARRAVQTGLVTGVLGAGGPGLRLAILPDAVAVAEGKNAAMIRAGDIRLLAGALWQAGAEAMTVGGVRLTSTTAIRDVGDQIQVGFEPLAAPYVIEAIGPAPSMEVALASGRAGDRISLLKGLLGATVTIDQVEELELPPALDAIRLYYAHGKE
jgi:uncharacterized protein YlxW (UPF0749 family)